MPSKNPKILKKHRDAWYKKNKDKQISRQMERREDLLTFLWEYKKQKSCFDCGMSFKERPECCDFHHSDPSKKDGSIRSFVCYSKKRALQEIDKCIPLCSNCHRTRHSLK